MKRRIVVAWRQNVEIKHMWKNECYMELRVESEQGENFQVIFVHASTNAKERQRQWEILKGSKEINVGIKVGDWGDVNDIKNNEEKKRGNRRHENSFGLQELYI